MKPIGKPNAEGLKNPSLTNKFEGQQTAVKIRYSSVGRLTMDGWMNADRWIFIRGDYYTAARAMVATTDGPDGRGRVASHRPHHRFRRRRHIVVRDHRGGRGGGESSGRPDA